jgi:hypothetical protein
MLLITLINWDNHKPLISSKKEIPEFQPPSWTGVFSVPFQRSGALLFDCKVLKVQNVHFTLSQFFWLFCNFWQLLKGLKIVPWKLPYPGAQSQQIQPGTVTLVKKKMASHSLLSVHGQLKPKKELCNPPPQHTHACTHTHTHTHTHTPLPRRNSYTSYYPACIKQKIFLKIYWHHRLIWLWLKTEPTIKGPCRWECFGGMV